MKYNEWRGISGLVYARLTKDENAEGGLTYGEVKPLSGAQKISKKTETSSDTKYYDNIPAIVIEATGPDEVTLTVSVLDNETLADITGQFYDEKTGMLVEGERETRYFAIGYIAEKDDGSPMYVWRYKGTFSIPEDEHNTKDSGTDSKNQEITYTGINTAFRHKKTGKTAKAINVDVSLGLANVEGFFDKVTLIDELKAKEDLSL